MVETDRVREAYRDRMLATALELGVRLGVELDVASHTALGAIDVEVVLKSMEGERAEISWWMIHDGFSIDLGGWDRHPEAWLKGDGDEAMRREAAFVWSVEIVERIARSGAQIVRARGGLPAPFRASWRPIGDEPVPPGSETVAAWRAWG